MGTGIELTKPLGTIRGWGNPQFRGFSGILSPKIPEFPGGDGDNSFGASQGHFGDGDSPNFQGFSMDLQGIPENPQT